MAKQKSVFVCQDCGYESNGWLGKCPACNNWNTFTEERQVLGAASKKGSIAYDVKPVNINDISIENVDGI